MKVTYDMFGSWYSGFTLRVWYTPSQVRIIVELLEMMMYIPLHHNNGYQQRPFLRCFLLLKCFRNSFSRFSPVLFLWLYYLGWTQHVLFGMPFIPPRSRYLEVHIDKCGEVSWSGLRGAANFFKNRVMYWVKYVTISWFLIFFNCT